MTSGENTPAFIIWQKEDKVKINQAKYENKDKDKGNDKDWDKDKDGDKDKD